MRRRREQLALFSPVVVEFFSPDDDEPSTPYDPAAPSADPWGLAPAGVDPDDLRTVSTRAPGVEEDDPDVGLVFGRDEIDVVAQPGASAAPTHAIDDDPLPDETTSGMRFVGQDDDDGQETEAVPGWPSFASASAESSSARRVWHVEHAFAQNEAASYGGREHLVLDVAFARGRLARAVGDALCRRRRKFSFISPPGPAHELPLVTCRKCREIAARHGFDLTDPRKLPAASSAPVGKM
jgi:hypothetical protein